jgi:broad specificity phosphatase PhoE
VRPTVLHLIRHGATEANLADPPRLLGRRLDPPLAPLGIRQAEAARDALAQVPLTHCYSSPLQRAIATAAIVATPHGLSPQTLEPLTECDLGHWEGLDWNTIRRRESEACASFFAKPGRTRPPGGETYQEVHTRASAAFEHILNLHRGEEVVAVAHHVVLRTYLAGLRGLPLDRAREISLANGEVIMIIRCD